ncbi:MAG: hypothetical protein J6W64_04310, partial [Bacilli bacterium]|nr:hypothetical protein [Bacilli bacterium]
LCCFCKDKNKKYRCCKCIKSFIFVIAFGFVLLTDIELPISLHNNNYKINIINITNSTELNKDNETSSDDSGVLTGGFLPLVVIFLLIFLFILITSSYTIIMLYSTTSRRYISGDFLSGKKINDGISLMKTIQEVCSYSFPLVYCNYYILKTLVNINFIFYDIIYIPDYEIINGVGIYMIAKIVIAVLSIFIFKCFGGLSFYFFKNDMDGYNKNINKEYNVTDDGAVIVEITDHTTTDNKNVEDVSGVKYSQNTWISEDDGSPYIIGLRIKGISGEVKERIVDFASNNIGKEYNYLFIKREERFYCTDLVSRAYEDSGININYDGFFVTGNDMIVSGETYIIFIREKYVENGEEYYNIYYLQEE